MKNNKPRRDKQQMKREQLLEQKQRELDKLQHKREQLQYELAQANRLRAFLYAFHPRVIKQTIRTFGAFMLGRRNPRQLYSRAYKRKQASNDILPYTRALYTKGFRQKALDDLKNMYETTTNQYLHEAIAWELALWYARYATKDHAKEALKYLQAIDLSELDQTSQRKHAIITAECYLALEESLKAKQTIINHLKTDKHPDLYLALANCQTDPKEKIKSINNVFKHYDLTLLDPTKTMKHYDDLTMQPKEQTKNQVKISVILPAYNAEEGIKVAIESILNQTWQNIELLIIDDCSTDNTWQILKQYAKKDARIRLFQTKENSGPYVARNIGLKQATGDFVTVNDADDWSHVEKLEIQANHLIANDHMIANTSEQARLLEDLTFYRRGTPGMYIFSNMSSLMFRRKIVMEKLGYFDEVRFAADGEFKRRLVKVFGKEAIVDLKTGPLSFPRQSKQSLTASSAFGYDGFFMGARREYVASFTHYHENHKNLYYPKQPKKRPFPVPEPMLPKRQKKIRTFDIAIAADFYNLNDEQTQQIKQEINMNKQLNLKTALIQMDTYTLKRRENKFSPLIRCKIDGEHVQSVVYGEKISCKLLIIHSPLVLQEKQIYLPKIDTLQALIIIDELPYLEYNSKKVINYNVRQCLHHLMMYTNKRGRWYPVNETLRQTIEQSYAHDFRLIHLANENWSLNRKQYMKQIEPWLIDE